MLILNGYLGTCLEDRAVDGFEVRLTASGGFVATARDVDRQAFRVPELEPGLYPAIRAARLTPTEALAAP